VILQIILHRKGIMYAAIPAVKMNGIKPARHRKNNRAESLACSLYPVAQRSLNFKPWASGNNLANTFFLESLIRAGQKLTLLSICTALTG
jgi:hypothetical protein